MDHINSLKVLVVDDISSMRYSLIKILKNLGIERVTEASNGLDALELLDTAHKNSSPFNLVLSDINMPKMTGMDLLQRVRANVDFMDLPFVLISTENEKPIIIKALKFEVSDYIIKPFDEIKVEIKLNELIQKFFEFDIKL